MAACPACGKELAGEFSYCPYCAAPVGRSGREQRKTVTVLFCDVTGSTALGESSDPEVLRSLLARYFDRMRGLVEAHGGTVEKFIGDAVMAVFGVPVAHEDDALRAVRAAAEMSEAVRGLGIEARIGVNTGEVVTGTEERLATGDAVNVAARLEQAADPGEVLLGAETMRRVDGAVEAELVGPLALKGKSEPVPAYRLVRVGEAPERVHGDVFVGRDRELELILESWGRVVAEGRCELLTIVAEAGLGKTRLVAESLSRIDARAVRGRCLPYGEGITYWPVVEVVKQLGAEPSDPVAAHAVATLLDDSAGVSGADEIAWGVRKLLEEQAPLVCVFDDLQWGEDTFLDLIEHVALLSSGAPVLLLCTARPELLDRRPAWPGTIRLEPLADAAVDRLVPKTLPEDLRGRISHAAGGNPLFIVEIVAMARAGDVIVPPNLQALLTARLDQLEPAERVVLERGSVEGEIFHRGAVQSLAPEETRVTTRLASLVRRELVRPDRAQIQGEDAFRFRHLLIRDAAYDGLPKSVRAELHSAFAAWLDQHGTNLVELDEVVGHHLEQAARYRIELGQPEPELAQRGGARLAAAGRRALWRADDKAAQNLLRRSLELTRPYGLDVALELDYAAAVWTQEDPEAAIAIAEAAARRAREAGDRAREALALAHAEHRRTWLDVGRGFGRLEALLAEASAGLDDRCDHAEFVHVNWLLAYGVHNFRARFEDVANASLEALRHARSIGWHGWHTYTLSMALLLGPQPADEAIRTLLASVPSESHPDTSITHALLLAMLGDLDESRRLADDALPRMSDLWGWGEDMGDPYVAEIAFLDGDLERAVDALRAFCAWLERRGQVGNLSYYEPRLGRLLCLLERHEEAEPMARRGRELTTPGDVVSEVAWRATQALVESARSNHEEAEQLAREALALAEASDSPNMQGDALWDLAEVLAAAGKQLEARVAFEDARARFERKRNVVMSERMRARLERHLRGAVADSGGSARDDAE